MLRASDLPVSSAHVIEAVRLAETLAALRGRPLAGLAEVTEATRAVLCEGDEVAAELVTADLVVGERLGAVPRQRRRCRWKPTCGRRARTLRLKIDPLDRDLDAGPAQGHRPRPVARCCTGWPLLGIGWGSAAADAVQRRGTFRETWTLRWRPELAVAIIDAAQWGTTVAAAAAARVTDPAAGPPASCRPSPPRWRASCSPTCPARCPRC